MYVFFFFFFFFFCNFIAFAVSILLLLLVGSLLKSMLDRYRPDRIPIGPRSDMYLTRMLAGLVTRLFYFVQKNDGSEQR